MTQKRVCLTCKNKGCVSYCRFVTVESAPQQKPSQDKLKRAA